MPDMATVCAATWKLAGVKSARDLWAHKDVKFKNGEYSATLFARARNPDAEGVGEVVISRATIPGAGHYGARHFFVHGPLAVSLGLPLTGAIKCAPLTSFSIARFVESRETIRHARCQGAESADTD